jgi:hypothetical protein
MGIHMDNFFYNYQTFLIDFYSIGLYFYNFVKCDWS